MNHQAAVTPTPSSSNGPEADRLAAVEAKLDRLSAQLEQLVAAQRPFVELAQEMGPISKAVMDSGVEQMAFLEQRGYFAFAQELKYLIDRLVEDYDPGDLHELADNAANILDTVRQVTQPSVMAMVRDAADAFAESKQVQPTGVFGAWRRLRKDKNAQRGLSFALDILGRVGRAVARAPRFSRKELRALPGGSAPVAQALAPTPSSMTASATTAASCHTASGSAGDDMTFVPDDAWDRPRATAIAAQVGLTELSDEQWKLVELVRAEYKRAGATPNIRKLTGLSGLATRDVYTLFPVAPGKTLARIAGVPKPVGCL